MIPKKSEATGNKIADRITKVSKTSQENNSETNEEDILRERFIKNSLDDTTNQPSKFR